MKKRPYRVSPSQMALAGIIAAVTAGMLFYEFLHASRLNQTAALFIGLPALIGIILSLTPKAKSPIGMVIKGMTIALLASAIFLKEGFICILIATPLFVIVGTFAFMLVNGISKFIAKYDKPESMKVFVLLPFLILSLEGVSAQTTVNRAESITIERIIETSVTDVETAMAQSPRFDLPLPLFLRLGFPVPVAVEGSGLMVGNRRVIQIAAGNRPPGVLAFEITQRNENSIGMQAVSDTSAIANWLTWKEIRVSWAELPDGSTLVTWTIQYDRMLDPAWYFGPIERYAVELAGNYWITSLAIP